MQMVSLLLNIWIIAVIIQSVKCKGTTEVPTTVESIFSKNNKSYTNKSVLSFNATKNVSKSFQIKSTSTIASTNNIMTSSTKSTKQSSGLPKNPFRTTANIFDIQYCRMIIDSSTEATSAMTEPEILAATEPHIKTLFETMSTETTTEFDAKFSNPRTPKIVATTASSPNTSTVTLSRTKITETTSTTTKQFSIPTTTSSTITTTESTTSMPIVTFDDATFLKIGTYRGFNDSNEYQKTYFIPRRFRGDWMTAKVACKTYEMELATFETLHEFTSFQQLWEDSKLNKNFNSVFYLHVDGITKTAKSLDDWYFTKNGQKIPFQMPWLKGEPNCFKSVEYCLSIGKKSSKGLLKFNDLICYNSKNYFHFHSFVCQKIDFVFAIEN